MPLGREVDLGPGDILLDGDPGPPPPSLKGAQQLPSFRHVSTNVAKRSPISATAEHLLSTVIQAIRRDLFICD